MIEANLCAVPLCSAALSLSALCLLDRVRSNWQLLPRTALLSEVVNAFDAAERNGKRLDAILVTQSGRATESLLGIVTIHDIPKVLRELTK